MSDQTAAEQLVHSYPLISDQMTKVRIEIILKQLSQVLADEVPGQIVEFGCYLGTTSLFIRRLLNCFNSDREYHVYDSFQGLPAKSIEDASVAGSDFKAGELKTSKRHLIVNFKKAGLKTPFIHKGWFDDLSDRNIPSLIAFAFIDCDFYNSVQTSLEKIYTNLSPGATIVIDDFQKSNLPGATRAVEEFCADHNLIAIHQQNLAIIKLIK